MITKLKSPATAHCLRWLLDRQLLLGDRYDQPQGILHAGNLDRDQQFNSTDARTRDDDTKTSPGAGDQRGAYEPRDVAARLCRSSRLLQHPRRRVRPSPRLRLGGRSE